MRRVLAWPIHRPRSALAAALVVTALALLLIFRLKPETSLAGLLDPHDPGVAAMSKVLNDFPVVNEALVLASLPEGSGADGEAKLIAFAERLRSATANDPQAKQILMPARYEPDPSTRAFVEQVVVPNGVYYLDDSQLSEALHRLTKTGMQKRLKQDAQLLAAPGPAAGALAKTLARDPLGLHDFLIDRIRQMAMPGSSGAAAGGGPFFSPDHRSLLIRIGGQKSAGDFVFARQVTQAVDRLIAAANTDHLRVDVAGAYAMSAHSANMIQGDSYQDIVSTVLGLVILFALACRRPARLFTFAFLPVAAGMIWGFGAYALLWHTITPLAAVVGGTLGAIGLDYTTHFITHYQDQRRKSPTSEAAILETSHELLLPSLAAWMTSVIGFAAVGISPVRVLRDFSILGTLCLIGAWLSTLLVLPAMLAIFNQGDVSPFTGRFHAEGGIFDWLSRHARALTIGSGVTLAALIAATLWHGVHIEMESDPMILHPRPSPPLEAQRRIASRMQTAAGSILVHLEAPTPAKLVSLAHQVHDRLQTAAVSQAGITGTFGLDALLPDPAIADLRKSVMSADRAAEVMSDFRRALADSDFAPGAYDRYVGLLQQLIHPGTPPGIETLTHYPELSQLLLPRNASATPATEAVTLIVSRTPLDTRDEREAALAAVRGALNGVAGATVTGTVVIGHDLEVAVHRDLPRFVAVALICIAGYLLLHFRSFALAAFALLPIGVSLIVVLACFCLAGVKLNLLHTVMAPLLLGINLDYGIFAVHAWRDSRDRGDMRHHFTPALAGLLICGGSTVIGFGSLIITSVPAIKSLGWLVNVGVISCVLATLLVQWPVMLLANKSRDALPEA